MKDRRIPDSHEHEMPFPPMGGFMMPERPYMPGDPQLPNVQPMPGMPCMPGYPCVPQETVIRDVKLAMAYVPFQRMCNVYSPIEGLAKGTIFPELYSPYVGVDKKSKPPEYE